MNHFTQTPIKLSKEQISLQLRFQGVYLGFLINQGESSQEGRLSVSTGISVSRPEKIITRQH